MKKLYSVAVLLTALLVAPIAALAIDAAGLALQINTFDHGGTGTLSATPNGNTVNVTGRVTGATNSLELYLDPGVYIRWTADYQAEIPDAGRNVLLFEGGELEIVSGNIGRNSPNGCTIVIHNCKLHLSGGTVSAGSSGISVYATLNSSVTITDGRVENGVFISDGVASITGGAVSSAEGYVLGVVAGTGAIGYMADHVSGEGSQDHINRGATGLIASVTASAPLPQAFIGTDEGFTLTHASPGATAKWVNSGNRADIEVSFAGTVLTIPMGLEISGMTGILEDQNIYIAIPTAGQMPQTTITGAGYTGTVLWKVNGVAHPDSQPFDSEEIYTAAVTLTASEGWQWTNDPDMTVNGQAVSGSVNGNILTFEAVFPKIRKLTVGSQNSILTGGTGGTVTFPMTTAHIPDGTYNILLNGAPAGLAVPAGISAAAGTVAITGNAGTLALDVMPSVLAGAYPLTVTVDGSISSNSFYMVVGSVSKSLAVGAQTGKLTSDMDDFATFAVTAANISDGYYPAVFTGIPAGVILPESVFIHENRGRLAIGITTDIADGVYPLTVSIDGVTSGSFHLTVEPPTPFITVGQSGLDELKVGQEVNGAVLFMLENGEYTAAITPEHFAVSGLPQGLAAGTAVRIGNELVSVPVTGTPTVVTGLAGIVLPPGIPSADVQGATAATGIWGMVEISVAKGDGAIVDVPVPDNITHNSITIHPVSSPDNGQTVEYAVSDAVTLPADRQTGTAFTGLNANTVYYIFARTAENDTYSAGYPVYAEVITLRMPVVNTGDEVMATYDGGVIDLPGIDGLFAVDAHAGMRTYTVEAGSTGTGSINGNHLTVTGAGAFTIGLVTAINGSYAAGTKVTATLTVSKGAGAKTDAPALSGLTHNSITVVAATPPVNGQTSEYAVSQTCSVPVAGWQTALTFTSLNPGATYYVFARSGENALYLAGEAAYTETATYLTSTHGVTLSENGTYTFPGAEYGYRVQTPLTVTVTSMGNQPTGLLTVELTGTDADQFKISENGAASGITVQGGTATFKVAPNSELTVGTYTAAVTLSDAGGISAGFHLSFTVNRLPVSNSGGTAAVTYSDEAVDLSGVAGLFTPGTGAGARTYSIEPGGTGSGVISGNDLAVTGAGTFMIGLVTAINGNYAESGKVTATLTVNRGMGASVEAPAPSGKTHNRISISAVNAPTSGQTVEYAVSKEYAAPVTGWQTGTDVTDLNAHTLYYIFARSRENGLYHSGAASCTAIPVKTNRISIVNTGGETTVIYGGEAIDLSSMDGLFAVNTNAGRPAYTIESGSTGTGSISGNGLIVAKVGTFVIGLVTAINGSYAACPKVTATLEVKRGIGATADVPTLLEKTDNSITVHHTNVSGDQQPEYAISTTDAVPAEEWQASPAFTGLTSGVTYYIFVRTEENSLYCTGIPSNALQVTIDRVTGMEDIPAAGSLKAWIQNGRLHVSGLAEGKPWRVFNASGNLVFHSMAAGTDADMQLPCYGLYIVWSENRTVKVAFVD